MTTFSLRQHTAALAALAALQLILDLTPDGAQAARAELPRYSVQLLPAVPTYGDMRRVEKPVTLNNNGVVGGSTQLWSGSNVETHATLWSASGVRLLDGNSGMVSEVRSINDSGAAVGRVFGAAGGYSAALRWNADGTVQNLGETARAFSADAKAINASGQVAGTAAMYTAPSLEDRPVLWQTDGSVTSIGHMPRADNARAFSEVTDLNDSGTILGSTFYSGSNVNSPWRWSAAGGMSALQKFSATSTERTAALNRSGWAVGFTQDSTSANTRPQAVMWNLQGQQVGLQGNGWVMSMATDISDAGVVIGVGDHNDLAQSWIWSAETGMVDLNTLVVDRPGFLVHTANAINDLGQIAGWGYDSATGQGGVFLLTPVPEPASAALLGAGLLALLWRRRCSRRPAQWQHGWCRASSTWVARPRS